MAFTFVHRKRSTGNARQCLVCLLYFLFPSPPCTPHEYCCDFAAVVRWGFSSRNSSPPGDTTALLSSMHTPLRTPWHQFHSNILVRRGRKCPAGRYTGTTGPPTGTKLKKVAYVRSTKYLVRIYHKMKRKICFNRRGGAESIDPRASLVGHLPCPDAAMLLRYSDVLLINS